MTKISNQYSLTNVLFADAVNGRVGIGTASPNRLLEVSSGSDTYARVTGNRGNGSNLHISNIEFYNSFSSILAGEVRGITGSTGTQSASGQLAFYTNNAGSYAERMRITSIGSVGINGNPGSYSNYIYFDIIGNSSTQGGLLQSRSSDDSTIGSFFANSNGLNVRTETTHPILFSPNGVERMRITTGGNVQIKNSTADTAIEIFYNGTTSTGAILADANNFVIGGQTGKGLTFCTNNLGQEKMRITVGGNVLVGTTTDSSYRLTANGIVAALGSSCSLLFQNRTSTNTYEWYATSNTIYIYSSSAAANILSINGSNGTYTALSDINKKKDFEQSNIGLNEVLQLKPTLYRMKTDDESSIKELGFIAQEVKEFIPQAYNESGEGEDKFIGLNQMPLIAALTKSIQEQQLQINELKALLNA